MTSHIEASISSDRYDDLVQLADLFEATGDELRRRARLGVEVLGDEDVAASEELSAATYAAAADDIRAATTGRHGVLNRSIELDADALVVRATVLTYRWIDELQDAAYHTLGSIAGRAIGYLAPEVALGGAIVSAGLIETDVVERDGIASYLGELAERTPTCSTTSPPAVARSSRASSCARCSPPVRWVTTKGRKRRPEGCARPASPRSRLTRPQRSVTSQATS